MRTDPGHDEGVDDVLGLRRAVRQVQGRCCRAVQGGDAGGGGGGKRTLGAEGVVMSEVQLGRCGR